ncbi:MAG: hypothetical protein V2J10_03465 [Wenzhouxiangella sp.]|jgi:hypothetical protein|nr:hypothetical protein [Wenzhouxiangella sp.]
MFRPALIQAVLAWLVLASAGSVWAAQLKQIDAPIGTNSLAPRWTPIDGERAVLSWLEEVEAGHRFMAAEFDGRAFGPARSISAGDRFFANWADTPGVRVGADGTWLAHWLLRSGLGTYAYDVMMALSPDGGITWSEPFLPHDDGTLTEHGFVSTFLDPHNQSGIGAVWLDGRETEPAAEDRDHDHGDHHHHGSGSMTLRSATIQADGRIDGATLLDDRVCDCCPTDAAATDDGAIVVYRDRSDDEIRDISLIRLEGSGWSEPITVHPDGWRTSACPVNGPALLVRDEIVIVAWFTMADDHPRVHLARSDDGGRSFEAPVVLDSGTALGRVDLAWSGNQAVLSWLDERESRAMLRVARFDLAGRLLEQHDLMPLDEGRISGVPRILGLDDARVLVTWTESSAESGAPRVRTGFLVPP